MIENTIPRMNEPLMCRLMNVRIIGSGRLPKEDLQTIDDAIDALREAPVVRSLNERIALLEQQLAEARKDAADADSMSKALAAVCDKNDVRWKFLHTINKDAQGFEWCVMRVKWENGRISEAWHTNSDMSDMDAAIALSAAPAAPEQQEPDCPRCGNNRQVWTNQISGEKTCHRVDCHTVVAQAPNAQQAEPYGNPMSERAAKLATAIVPLLDRIAALTAQLEEADKDAARYRWVRSGTCGERDSRGRMEFCLPGPHPVGNIMKGSVAQHLDASIDAAISSTQEQT